MMGEAVRLASGTILGMKVANMALTSPHNTKPKATPTAGLSRATKHIFKKMVGRNRQH